MGSPCSSKTRFINEPFDGEKIACIQGYHDIDAPLNKSPFTPDVSPLNYLYRGRQMSVLDNCDMSRIPPCPQNIGKIQGALAKRDFQNRQYFENINKGMFDRGGTQVDPTSFGNQVNPDEVLEQPKVAIFDPPSSAYVPMLEGYDGKIRPITKADMFRDRILNDAYNVPLDIGSALTNLNTDQVSQTLSTSTGSIMIWTVLLVFLIVLVFLINMNRGK